MAPLISTMTPRCKCRCPYFGKRKLRDRKWIMTQEVGGIGLRDDWIWNSPRRTSTEICYLMDREVTAQSGRNLASMTCRRAVRKPSWGSGAQTHVQAKFGTPPSPNRPQCHKGGDLSR